MDDYDPKAMTPTLRRRLRIAVVSGLVLLVIALIALSISWFVESNVDAVLSRISMWLLLIGVFLTFGSALWPTIFLPPARRDD